MHYYIFYSLHSIQSAFYPVGILSALQKFQETEWFFFIYRIKFDFLQFESLTQFLQNLEIFVCIGMLSTSFMSEAGLFSIVSQELKARSKPNRRHQIEKQWWYSKIENICVYRKWTFKGVICQTFSDVLRFVTPYIAAKILCFWSYIYPASLGKSNIFLKNTILLKNVVEILIIVSRDWLTRP